jgi:DnaK suppressor protein
MGKSASSRTVKKAVHKMPAEPANNNGRRHDVQAVRLVKPSSRAKRGSAAQIIVLPEGYRPTEGEPFMNERHKIYFRNKLIDWKEEIVRQNRETLHLLHEDSAQHADFADRATSETDRALELRARDRQRKLIAKIDAALARLEDGSYGYCEETGEPIGLRRLEARPIATLSLEAQERHERREKVFRED